MTETETTTLEQFITDTRIAMKVQSAPENPNLRGDEWEADHWFYTLNTSRRQMSGYYSMGIGHRTYKGSRPLEFNRKVYRKGDRIPMILTGKVQTLHTELVAKEFTPTAPTLAEVLDCLASDAATVENARTFEEWASELGYDTDSREAYKTYKVTKRQTEKLRALLGPEWFDRLLWHTERL